MIKYLVYGHIDKCMYISHKNMLKCCLKYVRKTLQNSDMSGKKNEKQTGKDTRGL